MTGLSGRIVCVKSDLGNGSEWRTMDKTQMEKEDIAYRQQVVNEYRADVEKLARYVPWLESKNGMSVQQSYAGSVSYTHLTLPTK